MPLTTEDLENFPVFFSIKRCARCGGKHNELVFTPFTRKVRDFPSITHWAMCPDSEEPILLHMLVDSDVPNKPVKKRKLKKGKK